MDSQLAVFVGHEKSRPLRRWRTSMARLHCGALSHSNCDSPEWRTPKGGRNGSCALELRARRSNSWGVNSSRACKGDWAGAYSGANAIWSGRIFSPSSSDIFLIAVGTCCALSCVAIKTSRDAGRPSRLGASCILSTLKACALPLDQCETPETPVTAPAEKPEGCLEKSSVSVPATQMAVNTPVFRR